MKEVFYSERPSVFQTYENGEVQYRWDFKVDFYNDTTPLFSNTFTTIVGEKGISKY